MWHDNSKLSVAWSSATGASELSVFEQELPQAVESLSVEQPRGLRTHGSPRVAGQIPGAKHRVRMRTYDITVEPNGRMLKAKDAIREASRHRSEIEHDLERHKIQDPTLDGALGDKFVFRRERMKRFQVGSHFPALVSPRLVPSWRLSAAGEQSVQQPAQPTAASGSPQSARGDSLSVTRTTASMRRKQQVKHQEEAATPWLRGSSTEASWLISDRKPALYADEYDALEAKQRAEHHKARECWVGESTMLPPSTAAAKMSSAAGRAELESHFAAVRERGRALSESLKERYEVNRAAFQQEREAALNEFGSLSTFEQSVARRDQAELERRRAAARAKLEADRRLSEKKEDSAVAGLKGLASLRG
mmetsp:Transcript_60863/g.156882  ORF Transcript_60863/g.156882 Transcript_60863/m.156882 type:complete len:363 (+) Transcript_60863:34-1122(+)